MPHITRALLSVSDKRGIVPFARALQAMHIEVISTGGTFAALQREGIRVTPVSEVTGFPEILDGRVKTLHPRIHAALLAVADNPDHVRQLAEHHIEPIELLVVNLYPFEQTIARAGVTQDEAIEQIDVGGPAMMRAAAKNFRHRAVVVDPGRYDAILAELTARAGTLSEETCRRLAQEAFFHTSAYDAAIAGYLAEPGPAGVLPDVIRISLPKEHDLRYGENPHQKGAVYGNVGAVFEKLHGKELSFNNIVDIAAAATLVAEFDEPTAAIIKHTNPCGVGSGLTLVEAYERALATDAKSAFGGIVAVNRPLDLRAAEKINEIFTEVIVAPAYEDGVIDFLKKKKDRRLLRLARDLRSLSSSDVRGIPGGLLVQEPDMHRLRTEELRVVTRRAPSDAELEAMLYAWKVAKHVKSNAIVYATGDRTIGIGAGQMSRVDSARIAALKAADALLPIAGTAVASDAFFPFADGLLAAVYAGSTAVIQPGGSVRDEEVIRAADEHGIAMVFTGVRHFRH